MPQPCRCRGAYLYLKFLLIPQTLYCLKILYLFHRDLLSLLIFAQKYHSKTKKKNIKSNVIWTKILSKNQIDNFKKEFGYSK